MPEKLANGGNQTSEHQSTKNRFWLGWWCGGVMVVIGNIALPFWGPSTGLWFLQEGWGCHQHEINSRVVSGYERGIELASDELQAMQNGN